jgi:MYXO-CTERM domain-containing protein
MTVTTYLYGNEPFRPMGHPIVQIDPERIARDKGGRVNYPMVVARTVDDAGGDGFVVEYRGASPRAQLGSSNCCGGNFDFCGVGGDGQCQCPGDEFDSQDCKDQGDLVEGIALVDALSEKYTTMTRLTTRISPEEMRFDPTFERDFTAQRTGQLVLRGTQASLSACASQVIDQERFETVDALQSCATLYCGVGGQCVTTAIGAACACGEDTVAQRFTDLDGLASVTCVPRVPTCDLRAGGENLPDACVGVTCGAGSCIDRNGVAVCQCSPGNAARAGSGGSPICEPIVLSSLGRGAADFSEDLRPLDVCAPPPPSCGAGGWLVKTGTDRPGVNCGGTEPSKAATQPGLPPTCSEWFGCGCQSGGEAPLSSIALAWLAGALVLRRRRRTAKK